MLAPCVALLALGAPTPGNVGALKFDGFDALLKDHPAATSLPSNANASAATPPADATYEEMGQLSCDKAESYIADAYQKSGEVRRSITDESAAKAKLAASVKAMEKNMTEVEDDLNAKTEILKQGLEKGIKMFEDLEESENPLIVDTYNILGAVENHIKVLHTAAALPWKKASTDVHEALKAKEDATGQVEMADAKLEALQEQLNEVHKQAAKYADCVDDAPVSNSMLKAL